MYIHYLKTVQLCFIPCSNLRALSYTVFLIQYCNMIYSVNDFFNFKQRKREKKMRFKFQEIKAIVLAISFLESMSTKCHYIIKKGKAFINKMSKEFHIHLLKLDFYLNNGVEQRYNK